jgi:creatinine amidohydrolase
MPLPSRFWQDLTWPEFRSLPANTVAVLPVGAIEQHGPHLPVAVDTAINQGIVARTLKVIPDDLPVLVLPTQAVALSVEHLRYPGTITTSAETLIALVCDIGASVARDGMWARMGKPEALRDPVEARFGIHAGRDETAVMLALRPDLVRMDKARNFVSRWQGVSTNTPSLAPDAGAPPAWQAQDLGPAGAVGNASAATVEIGEALLDHAAQRMAALWQQVANMDISAWLDGEPNPDA